MLRTTALGVALMFLLPAPALVAQVEQRFVADPLDTRELAKAKRALAQADVKAVERARAEAALPVVTARAKEFSVGRGDFYSLLDAAAAWRDHQLALCTDAATRFAVQERYWLWLRHIDDRTTEKYEAGRIGGREQLTARYVRLAADRDLQRARAAQGSDTSVAQLPGALGIFGWSAEDVDLKALAQAKRAALLADPKEVTRAQLDAARTAYPRQWGVCIAGYGSFYLLLRWAERLRDSGLALSTTEAERLACVERYWLSNAAAAEIEQARFAAGRIPLTTYLSAHHYRLAGDLELAEAWQKRAAQATQPVIGSDFQPIYSVKTNSREWGTLLDTKDLAQAKFKAVRANVHEHRREQLAAARLAVEEHQNAFELGRGHNPSLVHAAQRQLEAETALAENDADRRAALERYWARMHRMALVEQVRFEARRIPAWEATESVRLLRDAEVRLLELRTKAVGK